MRNTRAPLAHRCERSECAQCRTHLPSGESAEVHRGRMARCTRGASSLRPVLAPQSMTASLATFSGSLQIKISIRSLMAVMVSDDRDRLLLLLLLTGEEDRRESAPVLSTPLCADRRTGGPVVVTESC